MTISRIIQQFLTGRPVSSATNLVNETRQELQICFDPQLYTLNVKLSKPILGESVRLFQDGYAQRQDLNPIVLELMKALCEAGLTDYVQVWNPQYIAVANPSFLSFKSFEEIIIPILEAHGYSVTVVSALDQVDHLRVALTA